MLPEAIFVFILIGLAVILMASGRIRLDVISLLVLLALILSGILTPNETLSGFGSTVVINVAGLLAIGHMLDRTGIAYAIGSQILNFGGNNENRILVLIMTSVAGLGAFMSSTAVVAIFIPIVLRIAKECKIGAQRLLMPMSFAALISGMLTLIATSGNLIVNGELKESGYDGFGFFGFTILGISVLMIAILYFLFVGRQLLPNPPEPTVSVGTKKTILNLWEDYRGDRELRQLIIREGSPLVSKSIEQADLGGGYSVYITGIRRQNGGGEWIPINPNLQILAGDTLIASGLPKDLDLLQEEQEIDKCFFSLSEAQKRYWVVGAASFLVRPESSLIGKSISEIEFIKRYGIQVIGLRHSGEVVQDYPDAKLRASDSLLVIGPWRKIQELPTQGNDFVILDLPDEKEAVVPAYTKMPIALAILVGMVLLVVFDIVPLVAAVILAIVVATFTRCLSMGDAYKSINMSSIVLIASMLPLADALQKTGGSKIIVDGLIGIGISSPYVMMSVLFFLTILLGLFLPMAANTVLVAPIALNCAESMGLSPYPFMLAVLIAASSPFVTPISTPVVSLIVEPGRYRFADFTKVGLPLVFLTYLVTIILGPLVYSF